MLHAQDYDAAELKYLLPGIDFKTAIETIEVISAKTEDKQMYDQREEAQRDYEWSISGARQQGREEGKAVGLAKGREEGKIAGTIQAIQKLLGDAISSDDELLSCDRNSLASLLT